MAKALSTQFFQFAKFWKITLGNDCHYNFPSGRYLKTVTTTTDYTECQKLNKLI